VAPAEHPDPDGWVLLADVVMFRKYKRHGEGCIVIRRTASTTVHHPDCPHVREDSFIQRLNGKGGYWWVGSVAAAQRKWAGAKVCRHPSEPLAGGAGGPEAAARQIARTQPRDRATWSVDGPRPGLRQVRASSDRYIPFDTKVPELVELRGELRERLTRLTARRGEILHATFFGSAPASTDAENLLLYNVDPTGACFAAARHGLRFERSDRAPATGRPVALVYRPLPAAASFTVWELGDPIADWSFTAPSARSWDVWWAARQAVGGHIERRGYDGPICVRVAVSPPAGQRAAAPQLVKPVLDGVIGALQSDPGSSTLADLAHRLAPALSADTSLVTALLTDPALAALRAPKGPFTIRGTGVQLSPIDERCMAGELLLGSPSAGDGWAIACRINVAAPR
jgi:hypothetical protein